MNRALIIRTGITCLLLALWCNLFCQVTVKGSVSDSLGKPVASASVTLVKKNGVVSAFAISDNNGAYSITKKDALLSDTLFVKVTVLGYFSQVFPVLASVQTTEFRLKATQLTLPDVSVKSNKPMLRLEGDTLNYDVSAFSSPQDRVIGDILKKIPGVEVDANGKITIQGKEINRFYIDGDNLLDGKYNIATRGIPSDMVDKIQVLDNHQPVKALKDFIPSDNPAMNLVLKNKARLKITGQGDAALGSPNLYNGTLNLMLFQKQIKFINYYKLNNTGVDLNEDMISHFGGNQGQAPPQLLSVGTGNPPLKRSRYLLNNSGLVNVNNLFKLGNELQLRVNASYLYDKEYQASESSISYFLPNDTIHYTEKQSNRSLLNMFRTQFTLTANKTGYYLNDALAIENTPQQALGSLLTSGNSDISQQLSGTVTNLSNELNYMRVIQHNKNIIEGYSLLNIIRNPITLQVMPGLDPGVFNSGMPYGGLIQQVAIPTLFTSNYLSYKTGGIFRQGYKAGFSYQQQELNSTLEAQQLNGNLAPVADSFINRLPWKRIKIFAQADYSIVTGRMQLQLSIPVTYIQTGFNEHTRVTKDFSSIPVTPSLFCKYNMGKESYITFRYTYTDDWSDISKAFDGYIMQTYRTVTANDPFLTENSAHNATFSYAFRNTLKIFFFNINASFKSLTTNSIADNHYSSVLQQSRNIPFNNFTEAESINGNISKYIFALKTTFSAKFTWQLSGANQFLNNTLLQYRNISLAAGAEINTKLNKWCNFSYSGTISKFSSRQTGSMHPNAGTPDDIRLFQQQFDINLIIRKDLYCKLSGDYYFSHYPGSVDNKTLFADAVLTYKLDKLKTDIELSMYNIAGVDHYSTVFSSSNLVSEYTYQVRPRTILCKFLFRF